MYLNMPIFNIIEFFMSSEELIFLFKEVTLIQDFMEYRNKCG